MKKHLRILFALGALLAILPSCSTDVDLLADGADVPIVYSLLDLDADTNYVKITHTMNVNGTAINANNPDLANYPGKLDVRLTEFCNGDSIRQFILDTITIHNKEDGFFYSPNQKLYYTTERLSKNKPGKNYSYRLYVFLPDRVVTADFPVVGSDNFKIRSSVVDFSGGYHYLELNNKVTHEIWFNPALNGGIYDAYMSFTYYERRGWTSDTIPHTLTWHMGTYYQYYLPQYMHGDAFVITYFPYDIYKELDDYIGNDTLVPGLRRYLDDDPIRVTVTAGDRNLEEYIYFHNMNSGLPTGENNITNVKGGYGVVSTRLTIDRVMRLGGTTVPELVYETKWGFKYIGGHLGGGNQ